MRLCCASACALAHGAITTTTTTATTTSTAKARTTIVTSTPITTMTRRSTRVGSSESVSRPVCCLAQSALVVLLSAIALHRIGFGFALILAYSLGLAATITCIGLVAVLARRTFGRARFDGRLVSALPALSAVVILMVGIGITVKAIPGVMPGL